MTADLRNQLGRYTAAVVDQQPPITTVEAQALVGRIRELPEAAYPDATLLQRRVVVAAGVAVAILVLVGAVAWLSRGGAEDEIIDQTPPSIPPTTLAGPELDLNQIPLPIVGEAVTPSSIGDARWTVYSGEWTETLDEQVNRTFDSRRVDPSIVFPVFSTNGIAVHASGSSLGSVGDTTLAEWFVRVDLVETALMHADSTLLERSDNGRLLATYPFEEGIVQIGLFESEDQVGHYRNGREDISGPPAEIMAQYELGFSEGAGAWFVDVVDVSDGTHVGSISSGFPFDGWRGEGIYTLSTAGTVELVSPEWLDLDDTGPFPVVQYNGLYAHADDAFLVYVEQIPRDEFDSYEVWRSSDGKAWENLGAPSGWPVGYWSWGPIEQRNGVYLVAALTYDDAESYTDEADDGLIHLQMRSEDGINWSAVEDLPVEPGVFIPIEAGWLWTQEDSDFRSDLEVWTSPDGNAWERVDTDAVPDPAPSGRRSGSSNNTALIKSGDTWLAIIDFS